MEKTTSTVLALCVLAACGRTRLYEGPPRPREEVAVLRVEGTGEVTGEFGDVSFEAWIVGFDGRALERRTRLAEIEPGMHYVELLWKQFEVPFVGPDPHDERFLWIETGSGRWTLEVRAEAGVTYVLDWPAAWTGDPPRFVAR